MFKLLRDENLNGAIERALRRQHPALDIVRAQDTEHVSCDDFTLIGIATEENRFLISHDFSTLPFAFEARINAGLPVCGILLIRSTLRVSHVLSQFDLILGASDYQEWDGLLRYMDTT